MNAQLTYIIHAQFSTALSFCYFDSDSFTQVNDDSSPQVSYLLIQQSECFHSNHIDFYFIFA